MICLFRKIRNQKGYQVNCYQKIQTVLQQNDNIFLECPTCYKYRVFSNDTTQGFLFSVSNIFEPTHSILYQKDSSTKRLLLLFPNKLVGLPTLFYSQWDFTNALIFSSPSTPLLARNFAISAWDFLTRTTASFAAVFPSNPCLPSNNSWQLPMTCAACFSEKIRQMKC